jgi:hypothetical protein
MTVGRFRLCNSTTRNFVLIQARIRISALPEACVHWHHHPVTSSSTSEDADWIAPAGRRMIVQVNSTHPFGDEKPARSVGPRVRELGDHDREAYESDRKQHWRKVEPLPRTGSRGNSAHTLRTPGRRPRMSRDHVDGLRPATRSGWPMAACIGSVASYTGSLFGENRAMGRKWLALTSSRVPRALHRDENS